MITNGELEVVPDPVTVVPVVLVNLIVMMLVTPVEFQVGIFQMTMDRVKRLHQINASGLIRVVLVVVKQVMSLMQGGLHC